MFFVNDGAGGFANGWYGLATVRALMNNMVIYPDEAYRSQAPVDSGN